MRWGACLGQSGDGSDIGRRCVGSLEGMNGVSFGSICMLGPARPASGEKIEGGLNESMTSVRFSLKEFISAHQLPGNGPFIKPASHG